MQHLLGMAPADDALRQNKLTMTGDIVVRIPPLGLRLRSTVLMQQLRRCLQLRGWRPPG